MIRRTRLALCASLIAAVGCSTDGTLGPGGGDAGVDLAQPAVPEQEYSWSIGRSNQVDILLVIDNSAGMESLQREFVNRLSHLLKPFSDLADKGTYADLHVGVITTDYGAGATGAPGCTPSGPRGGDGGRLIAVGGAAPPSCRPPLGSRFVAYRFGPGEPVHNLPPNQRLDTTLSCMAKVGTAGCEFEHPLEAAYAALAGDLPENAGFLRPDARLVVVFITNEDDASAPPDSDLFDGSGSGIARYGYLGSYSRQTRFGVLCGSPAQAPPYDASNGPLRGCVAAPNPDGKGGPGKLYDVQRYIGLFTLPRARGGLKEDPTYVQLVGLDGPEAPFEVILSDPATPPGQPLVMCAGLDAGAMPPCLPVLKHGCVRAGDPTLFADPAVRLNTVIRANPWRVLMSPCGDLDLSVALDGSAKRVVSAVSFVCLTKPVPLDEQGSPRADCEVSETTRGADGKPVSRVLPRCVPDDSNPTCWKAEAKDACRMVSPDELGLTIVWSGDRPQAQYTASCKVR